MSNCTRKVLGSGTDSHLSVSCCHQLWLETSTVKSPCQIKNGKTNCCFHVRMRRTGDRRQISSRLSCHQGTFEAAWKRDENLNVVSREGTDTINGWTASCFVMEKITPKLVCCYWASMLESLLTLLIRLWPSYRRYILLLCLIFS